MITGGKVETSSCVSETTRRKSHDKTPLACDHSFQNWASEKRQSCLVYGAKFSSKTRVNRKRWLLKFVYIAAERMFQSCEKDLWCCRIHMLLILRSRVAGRYLKVRRTHHGAMNHHQFFGWNWKAFCYQISLYKNSGMKKSLVTIVLFGNFSKVLT